MHTYAYVTSEACRSVEAVLPDAAIGRNEIPVREHGDYEPWTYDEGETRDLLTKSGAGRDQYLRYAAREVMGLLGWSRGYKITHGGRRHWCATAPTIEAARELVRHERYLSCGYMDLEPHSNELDAIELWGDSEGEWCHTYAIEEL